MERTVSRQEDDHTQVERVDPLVGSILDGRYRIDRPIAAGGFGAIYRATHSTSGHQVALKVLHPKLTTDAGVVARFRREGAALIKLRNRHTITAYELGEVGDGTLYIVMELLHGESLYERYRTQGPLEWKRVVKIARAVCESLAEAHLLGIIHRDLKPMNIHLEPRDGDPDFVKVLDFGIAKIMTSSDLDSSDLTNAGQMIGTLDYMSPEQMVGGVVTGQSDLYTLGIVMYEMIGGERPFPEASSAAAVLAAMLRNNPAPLSKRRPVPAELDAIVLRCLEREPEQRYPDVEALAADLERVLNANKPGDVRTVPFTPIDPGDDDDEATEYVARRPALIAAAGRVEATPTPRVQRTGRSGAAADAPMRTLQLHVTPPPRPPVATPRPIVQTPPPAQMPIAAPHRPHASTPQPGVLVAEPPRPHSPTSPPPGGVLAPPVWPIPIPTAPPPTHAAGPSAARPNAPWPVLAPDGPPASDRGGQAAREAMIRRMVWIAVLVLGTVLGSIAAILL
jgi:eukaryotic-like serine/threonine-protein kinase